MVNQDSLSIFDIGSLNCRLAFNFDSCIGSSAVETHVKSQNDRTIPNANLAASSLGDLTSRRLSYRMMKVQYPVDLRFNTRRGYEISWDLFNIFEWRHSIHKGDTLNDSHRNLEENTSAMFKSTLFQCFGQRCGCLWAPLGARPSAGTVVTTSDPILSIRDQFLEDQARISCSTQGHPTSLTT